MTDEEVYNYHSNKHNRTLKSWREYIEMISLDDLMQIVRLSLPSDDYSPSRDELKTRQIPQELKLKVLLLVGEYLL